MAKMSKAATAAAAGMTAAAVAESSTAAAQSRAPEVAVMLYRRAAAGVAERSSRLVMWGLVRFGFVPEALERFQAIKLLILPRL